MEREKEWERFTATGKVTDYLTYRQVSGGQQAEGRREQQYERNSYRDRDGSDRITGQRIRQEN